MFERTTHLIFLVITSANVDQFKKKILLLSYSHGES